MTDLIERLFPEQRDFLVTVFPNTVATAVLAPSLSGEEVEVLNGPKWPDHQFDIINAADSFCHHSKSSQDILIKYFIQLIAGPLFSVEKSGEQNVRAYLVEPVMIELTKCLTSQSQPPFGCVQFTTTFNM